MDHRQGKTYFINRRPAPLPSSSESGAMASNLIYLVSNLELVPLLDLIIQDSKPSDSSRNRLFSLYLRHGRPYLR